MNSRQIYTATLAVLAGLATGYILLMSVKILVILLIAIIIASAARPLIARLSRFGVPSGLATLIIYMGMIFFALILAFAVLPPLINQFVDYLGSDWRLANRIIVANNWLETNLTTITGQTVELAESESIRDATTQALERIRSTAPELLDDVGNWFIETVLVIVMGIYWLTAREKSINFTTRLITSKYRENARLALLEIEESMGAYIRGIVFVALFIGTANSLTLLAFGVPNAAPLGFIIGVMTILPVIGSGLGGVIATLIALLGSPLYGLIVFGTFVVIQQIEMHYLTPRTISRSVGVDPLLVMLSVFVGFALYGVVGAIIAVPILSTINVLLRDFVIAPRQEAVANYSLEQGIPVFKPADIPSPLDKPAPLSPENAKP
jgi:predicted PurR-regulated permease PerM